MTWHNVQDDCMLCEMDKRTKWYYEDDVVVLADTLGPNPHPFVVLKSHDAEATVWEKGYITAIAKATFPDRELSLDYRGGLVPDHYHIHIVFEDGDVDLSGE